MRIVRHIDCNRYLELREWKYQIELMNCHILTKDDKCLMNFSLWHQHPSFKWREFKVGLDNLQTRDLD